MPGPLPLDAFHHEALLYRGPDGFLEATLPFLREGVSRCDPTLVVVAWEKIRALREALGDDAEHIRFADMARAGANPGRIIPLWHEFAAEHAGQPLRGIGEPITPARSAAALVECHRHESLLNVAFDATPGFSLLCPYDTDALPQPVIDEARTTHPYVSAQGAREASGTFTGLDAVHAPFADPLTEPAGVVSELTFDVGTVALARCAVTRAARDAGMSADRTGDLLLATSEVAANSVRHGGGRGVLRVWEEADTLLCELRDRGAITDPLVGRRRPARGQIGGYGLWLANEVCDLVQVRTSPEGSVVRLHMRLA